MKTRPFEKPGGRRLVVVAEDADVSEMRWMLVGSDRRVIQRGRATVDEPDEATWPMGVDRTVLITPGFAVIVRRTAPLSGRPAQMRASALYRLGEEGLAGPLDDLHLALGAPDVDRRRMAAAVLRGVLEHWRAQAARLGGAPDVIVPDGLCAPAPDTEDWTRLDLFDRVVLRGRDQAVTVEPDLAEMMTAGATVARLEDAEAVEAALIATAFDPPVNLLDGLARPTVASGGRAWAAAAVLAVLVALSPLMQTAAEAVRHDLTAGELDRRSATAARRLWPDMAPGADPATEVRARLGPNGGAGGFSGDVAALFSAMEPMEGLKVQMLYLEDDGALRLSVAHPDQADMTHLNTALEPFGLTLSENAMGQEDARALSDIRVTRR